MVELSGGLGVGSKGNTTGSISIAVRCGTSFNDRGFLPEFLKGGMFTANSLGGDMTGEGASELLELGSSHHIL